MTDWRQRKKAQTRRTLQYHALRLFAEQGYEATTIEQIAAAAGVSHMTFFRYFPTKEDVVADDDYDPLIEDLIRSRPAGEPPVVRVQAALREGLAKVYHADREALLVRARLMARTPALRARMLAGNQATQELLERALADGRPRTLETRVVAAACLAAMVTAVLAWAEQDTGPDGAAGRELPDLLDAAFRALRDQAAPRHRTEHQPERQADRQLQEG